MQISEHFSSDEIGCHCGCGQWKVGPKPELIAALEKLRGIVGMPINVHSAFRCANHPIERKKLKPGQHTQGIAADISVTNLGIKGLFDIIQSCPEVYGIGVNKEVSYIHFELRPGPRAHRKYTTGERTLPRSGKWEEI